MLVGNFVRGKNYAFARIQIITSFIVLLTKKDPPGSWVFNLELVKISVKKRINCMMSGVNQVITKYSGGKQPFTVLIEGNIGRYVVMSNRKTIIHTFTKIAGKLRF